MSHYFPSSNISEVLYRENLQQCINPLGSKVETLPKCCDNQLKLNKFFKQAPKNLWNTAPGQDNDKCINDAFIKQALMSSHYNYLSGNNSLQND